MTHSLFSRRKCRKKDAQRKRLRRSALRGEFLESRQLMVGDISGTVFIDANANGVDDPAENGLPGWTVFLDANANRTFDAGELNQVTDLKGKYAFIGLPVGAARVQLVLEPGFVPTTGFSDVQNVDVRDNKDTRVKFPLVSSLPTTGSVRGTVFDDVNTNGLLDGDENGLAGWQVFVDTNLDGALTPGEPNTVTDLKGDYTLDALTPGTMTIREIPQDGLQPVVAGLFPLEGASTGKLTTVIAGAPTRVDFANSVPQIGSLNGTVWHDANGDGIRGATEGPLAGRTVFIDLDSNGVRGAAEPSRVTDASGQYAFADIHTGTYRVVEELPAGWGTTEGSASARFVSVSLGGTTTVDFMDLIPTVGSIRGVVWNDLDANQAIGATEEKLSGWTVYVDANLNGLMEATESQAVTGVDGSYQLDGVTYGTKTIRVNVLAGWEGSLASSVSRTFRLLNGETRADTNFGVRERVGTIRGNVWHDQDGDRARDTTETGLADWTVFLDTNSDGVLGADEVSALTDSAGNYVFSRVPNGSYRVAEVVQSGWIASIGKPTSVTVNVSTAATAVADFYNLTPSPGSVSGVVFNDIDSDGTQSLVELGLAGWQVYADLNNNGLLEAGEPTAVTNDAGEYHLTDLAYGTVNVREVLVTGFNPTNHPGGLASIQLLNGENRTGVSFGNHETAEFTISGNVYHDANANGTRDAGERGLSGVTLYLDVNNNGSLDAEEPTTTSTVDYFFTPSTNELGNYTFTHLARGTYTVRAQMPAELDATAAASRVKEVSVGPTSATGIEFGAQYRSNEIHGFVFDDTNNNGVFDAGEYARPGISVYVDLNRNNVWEESEPRTVTGADGSYAFIGMTPGAYIVREDGSLPGPHTYPATGGGVLWPEGVSNPAKGNVTPTEITATLAEGETLRKTVSLTLPGSGGLSNMVDVFLLFDDTGSFTSNSPIVRAAFPTIISSLQAALPGVDLGFGVGRFEEYGSFAAENSSGRPFILNQPIISSASTGFSASIQAALDRMAPGYGGDGPETDIEALYQMVTGLGFDGNNNGSVLDSGRAGLASTQLSPGASGDVPNFESFATDPVNHVLAPEGNIGGAGFRPGALPIILTATDTGFAYQPKGETEITGVGGVTLPLTALTALSRATTPFASGAGIQETVTGLNALGALVIGLGTNADALAAPRQGLESLAKLTGATNRSASTIANGTLDPIAPGDPLYFQISSGFGSTVADGVVNAIQSGATNVAMDITVRASDPRVHITNFTGTLADIAAGQTATFDIEFVGDSRPHRFDLEFVREGTRVVLGSIPVVIGTPVEGEGYQYDELDDGEIHHSSHFGNYVANEAPSFIAGGDVTVTEDAGPQSIPWATGIDRGADTEFGQSIHFIVTTDHPELFTSQPEIGEDGKLAFTSAPNAFGTAQVTVLLRDSGGKGPDGNDTSLPATFTLNVAAMNDAPVAAADSVSTLEESALTITSASLLANDSDVDGDSLTAVLVSPPTHGTVEVLADGSFRYTPNALYFGSDQFTYSAYDGAMNSVATTVTIDVIKVNHAPTAVNDAWNVNEDGVLTQANPGVLANDIDVDGDALLASVVTGPAHGTLILNAAGGLTYTPTANYNGADSFTYRVSDGEATSNVATVALTVAAVNDAPTAVNDSYAVTFNKPLNVAAAGVLANDTDGDGDTLNASIVATPSHGTLSLQLNGAFTYTPTIGYAGPDSFTYRVTDAGGATSAATVALNVAAPAPKFFVVDANAKATYRYAEDGTSLTNTLLNKSDSKPRGIASNPAGTLQWVIDGSGNVFVYDNAGVTLGQWTPQNVGKPEGIAVWGNDLWLVDPTQDRVFKFTGGANLRTGRVNATSSFALNTGNLNSTDIATDGAHLWVLNDTLASDKVFRYGMTGALEGSWNLSTSNPSPSGLTIDPNAVNHLWVVDASTRRVYQYDGATARIAGTQEPSSSYLLTAANSNPQGIADPLMAPVDLGDMTTEELACNALDEVFAVLIPEESSGDEGVLNTVAASITYGPQLPSSVTSREDSEPDGDGTSLHDQIMAEFADL